MIVYCTSEEACRRLGITATKLRRLCDSGQMNYLMRPGEEDDRRYDIEGFLANKHVTKK
jgi:hypothetical protein